ncbi:MAG: hypothetical protein V4574_11315 [Pseudomonadota bacterium]
MTDIDAALARLRAMSVDPRLASIDAAVLEEVARAGRSHPLSASVFGFAALAALVTGIASTALPGAAASASPVAPFGTSPTLAPSALLSAGE